MDRARGIVTAEDLKVFSGVPTGELMGRHLQKLVQVTLIILSDYIHVRSLRWFVLS